MISRVWTFDIVDDADRAMADLGEARDETTYNRYRFATTVLTMIANLRLELE